MMGQFVGAVGGFILSTEYSCLFVVAFVGSFASQEIAFDKTYLNFEEEVEKFASSIFIVFGSSSKERQEGGSYRSRIF